MKTSFQRSTLAVLTLSTSFFLAACGSGNNANVVPVVPGTVIPVAATTDSAAATDFVTSLVATGEANTENPVTVGDVNLATSETADPISII